ncbi:hypothetical protein [Qipengyuania spongiae]|uniref:RNase H type-1 domain-containing protein n=1 Tax=Qipengyuania spongiae TaxID=2909673 RepID=A0ABY5SVQ3_9SPHN|nr:hypothetical protein [Qipengyuania spongiae]UVI38380.1 hypothetical protein L1F33_08905 [Qipengyuania spongiae]
MALSINTGSSQRVRVWISGSHREDEGEAVQVQVIGDEDVMASQHSGWQHEAAYRALAELMMEEHRNGTTELAIVTGNDVLEAHLMRNRPPKDRHHSRNVELVAALRPLFDIVRISKGSQVHAQPTEIGGARTVLGRPLGDQDGRILAL